MTQPQINSGWKDGEARALFEWLHSPEFRDAGLTGVQVFGEPSTLHVII